MFLAFMVLVAPVLVVYALLAFLVRHYVAREHGEYYPYARRIHKDQFEYLLYRTVMYVKGPELVVRDFFHKTDEDIWMLFGLVWSFLAFAGMAIGFVLGVILPGINAVDAASLGFFSLSTLLLIPMVIFTIRRMALMVQGRDF